MDIRIEDDATKGYKVLVLEFRWAEYRLELNDDTKARKLLLMLQHALGEKPVHKKEDIDMPQFYGEKK